MINIAPLIASTVVLQTATRINQQNNQRIMANKIKKMKEEKKKDGK